MFSGKSPPDDAQKNAEFPVNAAEQENLGQRAVRSGLRRAPISPKMTTPEGAPSGSGARKGAVLRLLAYALMSGAVRDTRIRSITLSQNPPRL